jgi:hypothetical protein
VTVPTRFRDGLGGEGAGEFGGEAAELGSLGRELLEVGLPGACMSKGLERGLSRACWERTGGS